MLDTAYDSVSYRHCQMLVHLSKPRSLPMINDDVLGLALANEFLVTQGLRFKRNSRRWLINHKRRRQLIIASLKLSREDHEEYLRLFYGADYNR
jgi:hypothetical protein